MIKKFLDYIFGYCEKDVEFYFPEKEDDIENIKGTIRFLQKHDDPSVRTIAVMMQKESRRTQFIIIRVIQLLAHK